MFPLEIFVYDLLILDFESEVGYAVKLNDILDRFEQFDRLTANLDDKLAAKYKVAVEKEKEKIKNWKR